MSCSARSNFCISFKLGLPGILLMCLSSPFKPIFLQKKLIKTVVTDPSGLFQSRSIFIRLWWKHCLSETCWDSANYNSKNRDANNLTTLIQMSFHTCLDCQQNLGAIFFYLSFWMRIFLCVVLFVCLFVCLFVYLFVFMVIAKYKDVFLIVTFINCILLFASGYNEYELHVFVICSYGNNVNGDWSDGT